MSSQCTFLHDFQTLHFICYLFGCKLLLQSIQNHCRDSFQAFAHRHLEWLCFSLESELTPFCRTGCQFRSATLHRIWFRTCWFVPMSCFYSEASDWLKDWAKWCTALVGNKIWQISHGQMICHHCPKFKEHSNLFDSLTWTLSGLQEWQHFFLKRASCYCSLLGNSKYWCLPTQPAQVQGH